MAAYMRTRYHQRRALAFEILGDVCSECGTTENLEIDHRDCFTKTMHTRAIWNLALDKYLAELKKCQVLCRACHRKKSIGVGGDMSKRALVREEQKRRNRCVTGNAPDF